MSQIAYIALTATVSSVVGAVVGALVTAIANKFKSSKAFEAGMRALLWRELKNIHAESMENGGMSVEDRRHLENVYSAYHNIGGNGTGTRLCEEAMNTPVLD